MVFQDQDGRVGLAEAPGPASEKTGTKGALNLLLTMAEAEGVVLEDAAAPTVLAALEALAEPPSLPIPALATTDEATLLTSMMLTSPSPEGQLERTDWSLVVRLPELTKVLGTQVRPRAELQADLSPPVTAKTLPESGSEGVSTLAKTLPSIKTLEFLPTSKAWPLFLYQ